jgi:molybdenum cofactor cytidylyltransferase
MSTSLHVGLDALPPEARAALIALGDQPEVGPEIVDPLLDRYRTTAAAIVAPIYRGGVRGNPVLFDRSLFAELRAVVGDEGGRSVIARDPSRVTLVGLDVGMPRDIDVPGDIAG